MGKRRKGKHLFHMCFLYKNIVKWAKGGEKSKMKKSQIILAIASIILVVMVALIILKGEQQDKKDEPKKEAQVDWNNPYTQIDKNEIAYHDKASIDELKQQVGLTADSDWYEINTEYDGRKVLNIKADIQYKVAFAGVIKKGTPNREEINPIMQENHPTENGLWIEEGSRESFLTLLKGNTNAQYQINEKGYLEMKHDNQLNQNDQNLVRLMQGSKKIIITIADHYYQVDHVTGEIVEYPFEKLDNYQTYDRIESGENLLLVISANTYRKLTNQAILEDVLQNESSF